MLTRLSLSAVLALGSAAALAEEPRTGGTLNFTAPYGASFGTLDSHATPTIQDELFGLAIHRAMYKWDSEASQPVLELATDVDVSEDGLTYTFHLRDNAVFHNGEPLTADDVIWSYQRLADPANSLPGARNVSMIAGVEEFAAGDADEISGLRAIDDHTLEMTLSAPVDPGFNLFRMTTAIYPAGATDDAGFQTHPIGLGPFEFVEHLPGSRIVVEKFDDYYIDGQPYLDRVNILVMGDASARDVAFRNQEIDVSILGSTQYAAYQSDASLSENILEVAEMFTRNVGFSADVEPLADMRVRQAINHAIDSDLIIERLLRGKAYRATSWLPTTSPAFDESASPYEYDPERAKELLAEAGYADGFSFTLTATQNESWGIPVVEAIIPMLAHVGIQVTANPVEASVLGQDVPGGNFEAYMWSNTSGPDPLAAMECFYSRTPQSACNYTAFDNAEFDALWEQARDERDPEARVDLLREANNLLQEQAPVWFFNYNKAVMAYQPWVHGLQANATELAIQYYEDLWIDDSAPASRQ
ncbi:MAG: ABC transporter substrate-binding protein [Paracoccus sp. (in: a-proteobacteria)]|nr:ABC transporter substrate-binding protein [Paracoccus sp. (in: a-proteobacteria)]